MVCLCLFVLLVDPLAPHEDFGLAVQRKSAVVFPEAVKQLHVFELPVLVTHWKHTQHRSFSFKSSSPAGITKNEGGNRKRLLTDRQEPEFLMQTYCIYTLRDADGHRGTCNPGVSSYFIICTDFKYKTKKHKQSCLMCTTQVTNCLFTSQLNAFNFIQLAATAQRPFQVVLV